MLVNLSNIFTRDETEKQLSAEFDFSAENVSYDATFEKPVAARLDLKKALTKHLLSLLYRQQLYVPAPDVLNCLKDNLISHEIL